MIFNLTIPEIKLPPPITYITFSSPSVFTLKTSNATKGWDGTLEYSTNTKDWSTWDGTELSSSSDNKLYLRGTGNTKITGNTDNKYSWVLTGSNISCDGNIENLLDYQTVLNGEHPTMGTDCYSCMFENCTVLTTAPELPATTLTDSCYSSMFSGCTALITAPELPATNLAADCYMDMFNGCTSLVTAPLLPATNLADNCYMDMFADCTSLTTAPELPAIELYVQCYFEMFCNCTSLTTVPALHATVLVSYCYYSMFAGCTKIKLSATKTGTYTQEYRIPTSGTGTNAEDAVTYMFLETGGIFTNTPEINTTYYLDSSNTTV